MSALLERGCETCPRTIEFVSCCCTHRTRSPHWLTRSPSFRHPAQFGPTRHRARQGTCPAVREQKQGRAAQTAGGSPKRELLQQTNTPLLLLPTSFSFLPSSQRISMQAESTCHRVERDLAWSTGDKRLLGVTGELQPNRCGSVATQVSMRMSPRSRNHLFDSTSRHHYCVHA